MITKVTKSIVYYIETNEEEYSDYIRHGSDNWDNRMGESYESVYNCEELEKEFQEYIKVKGYDDDSVDIANVMRSLQEKKKLWEERQSKYIDEEKSLTDDTDFDDERLILIENINLSEQIINDLEEIINQNFAERTGLKDANLIKNNGRKYAKITGIRSGKS